MKLQNVQWPGRPHLSLHPHRSFAVVLRYKSEICYGPDLSDLLTCCGPDHRFAVVQISDLLMRCDPDH